MIEGLISSFLTKDIKNPMILPLQFVVCCGSLIPFAVVDVVVVVFVLVSCLFSFVIQCFLRSGNPSGSFGSMEQMIWGYKWDHRRRDALL